MKVSRLKPDFFWIAGSQLVVFLVNIWLIKLLTNSLSLESYGYYSLFITTAVFARQVIYDPISYIIVRDCGQLTSSDDVARRIEAINLINDSISFWICVTSVIGSLFLHLIYGVSLQVVYALVFSIYLFTSGANGISLAILNILKIRKSYAYILVFDSVIKIAFVTFFIQIEKWGLAESIISITLGALATYLCIRFYFHMLARMDSVPVPNKRFLAKSIFINSLPLYLPIVLVALKGVGERWVLAAFVGIDNLAVFNVLFQLGFSPVVLAIGVVQTFVAPVIYHLSKENSTDIEDAIKYIYRLVGLIFMFGIFGFLISTAFGSEILMRIVSEDYYSYFGFFPVFVVAGAVAAAAGIVHLGVIGTFTAKTAGNLMSASMIIGITISVVSVIAWGYNGAILGLVASNAVTFLIYSAALLRKRKLLRLFRSRIS